MSINHDLEDSGFGFRYKEEPEQVKMNGGVSTALFRKGRRLIRVKVRTLATPSQIYYQTPMEGTEDDTKTSQWSDILLSGGPQLQINSGGNVSSGNTYLQETDAFDYLPEEFRYTSAYTGEVWLELWYRSVGNIGGDFEEVNEG